MLFPLFATCISNTSKTSGGVVDTGGNFVAGVVDIGDAPWLDSGAGETDSWKKPEAKNLMTLSF